MFQSASASDILCRKLLKILLCFAFILLTSESIQAEIITVCEEGCSHANMIAGISAAESGDTVEVHSGTYRENVIVTKHITLRGIDTGNGRPVVDAGQNGSAIILSADGIVIDGFETTAAVGNLFKEWAGIKVESSDNIISNNLASNNDNGIFLTSSANNTLSGNNATRNTNGIRLERSNNNDIKANYLASNNYGLRLASSANNSMAANLATDNDYGILMDSSEGNALRANLMYGNSYNFGAGGVNNVSIDNLVDNKPVYYLVRALGYVIDSSSQAGTVYCIDCSNVTIKNLTLKNNLNGIFLSNTTNSRLENNSVNNNSYGIRLISSSKNNIRNNEISNNLVDGLTLDLSDNNTIEDNTALRNNHYGFSILYSVGNIITANNVSINNNGVGINYSRYNLISGDAISFNRNNGLLLKDSSYNNIFMNLLNNNSKGLWSITSPNNTFKSNDVSGNIDGVKLEFSENNTISLNNIHRNANGILFDPLFTNFIRDNKIENNTRDNVQVVSATTARAPGVRRSRSSRS